MNSMGLVAHQILLVEDSTEFQKIVARALSHHQLTFAATVDEALDHLSRSAFNLILLDITLPGKNGYTLLSDIQAHRAWRKIPIFCLTGKAEVTDKVTAFSLGAEDYIIKPFDPLELRARVDAKLQRIRQNAAEGEVVQQGALRIDFEGHRIHLQSEEGLVELGLTQTEFKLLTHLAKRPGQVYSRQQLLLHVWGNSTNVVDRVVDVHIHGLRKKLGPCAAYIKAVLGLGYKFSLEKNAKKKAAA